MRFKSLKNKSVVLTFGLLLGLTQGCSNSESENPSDQSKQEEVKRQGIKSLAATSDLIAQKNSEMNQTKAAIDALSSEGGANSSELEQLKKLLADQSQKLIDLEAKLLAARTGQSLPKANQKIMQDSLEGHTTVYKFNGDYKVMVIPVQFSDVKFDRPDYFKRDDSGQSPAQDYLFGKGEKSLTTHYKHASLGQFNLEGEVMEPVTVEKTLEYYGEAITGSNDRQARRLVVDALLKIKEKGFSEEWWNDFDRWDLNDYDKDKHFYERDGFIDAVVLIYAGKSQASCQRSFDPEGTRPASADVPEGPRKNATVECFNRIWPHRWAVSLSKDDPLYSETGPSIEGEQLPSLNGLKIHDKLFALDYNMQSEFSDISTFAHEFGHSLTLPDIYAYEGTNNVGAWTLMASNASYYGQEFDSYSKLSLGWLNPKIIRQGQDTSAYVGITNFVANERREYGVNSFTGPVSTVEELDGQTLEYDILSTTPKTGEPVYRSLMVIPDRKVEQQPVNSIEVPAKNGTYMAYSGRFDGDQKSIKLNLDVPEEGDATLSFDTLYHIETATNFESNETEIKVVVDYDIGSVKIDGSALEDLRLISGDTDYDTLADLNADCDASKVKELRLKRIESSLSESEKELFKELTAVCQAPIWVTKSYDLSDKRGQTVALEISLTTDGGYTEFGVIVDNIKMGETLVDFEGSTRDFDAGSFSILTDGNYDKITSQFYLMEYRAPNKKFESNGETLSLNLDQNLTADSQSMFIEDGATSADRFRMVEFSYQNGLLVWYFNSNYDRRSNGSSVQGGQGYLLPVNANVGELRLPGVMGQEKLFTETGTYDVDSEDFKTFIEDQRNEFICFSHTEYATYLNGQAPDCSRFSSVDAMKELTIDGKPLIFRRENFNEVVPAERYNNYQVGTVFRNSTTDRTGLAVFRPESSNQLRPFRVYKQENGEMVLDSRLTENAPVFKAASSFRDIDNKISEDERFIADTAVVNKVGLNFRVIEPEGQLSHYNDGASASTNDNVFRAPQVKVILNWEAVDLSSIEQNSGNDQQILNFEKTSWSAWDHHQCIHHR